MARVLRAKVVIVGDVGVGKTCLLHRFVDDKFYLRPAETIAVDFKKRTIDIGHSSFMQLEVWDTAGQERYMSITSKFYRGTDSVILMFDVTDKNSFTRITKWVDEVEYRGIPLWKCLLLGNKTDLIHKRMVENTLAAALAHRLGIVYIETSVKEGINVETVFLTLAKQIDDRMKHAKRPVGGTLAFNLSESQENNEKKKKCRWC